VGTNNVNNVTKPLVGTNNVNNVTKPLVGTNNVNNVTKPLVGTNNVNNVTKPLAGTNNNSSTNSESSQKNNTEMVNYQLFNALKADQMPSKHTIKKSHSIDVFATSAEKSHGDSEIKKSSKAEKSHGDSETKDLSQSTQGDSKLNSNNISGENKKTFKLVKAHHNHKSIDPLSKDLNSNRSSRHNVNDFTNPSIPSNTFDLPFTALVPNNLF
ncbi:MAG TPA: hypothetical protein VN703_09080, partial [Candidatus Sulfopaludibacter sp.]|nr:hypothetical protein [Candidatus Sulfopaludibacter sp.]